MRIYETIIILRPQLSDNEVAEFVEKTKQAIAQAGGEVVSEEKMGRRRLSHPINHSRDGFYTYIKFKGEPAYVAKISQQLKLNEAVLRAAVMHGVMKEPVKPAAVKAAA